MGTVRRDVVDVVCRAPAASGDPDRATGQQAYMKSAMPLFRVGPALRAHPETEAARMRSWATADNLWVRRAAILSQLDTRLSGLSRREALKNLG